MDVNKILIYTIYISLRSVQAACNQTLLIANECIKGCKSHENIIILWIEKKGTNVCLSTLEFYGAFDVSYLRIRICDLYIFYR